MSSAYLEAVMTAAQNARNVPGPAKHEILKNQAFLPSRTVCRGTLMRMKYHDICGHLRTSGESKNARTGSGNQARAR